MKIALKLSSIVFCLAHIINPLVVNANPVTAAKTQIREAIEIWDGDNCAGVCSLSRQFTICNAVKDLDRQVGGKITGRSIKGKSKLHSIERSDLKLMQLVSSQCKLSEEELPPALKRIDIKNRKLFVPDCQALPKIRQGLGLEQFGGEHYRNNCSLRK